MIIIRLILAAFSVLVGIIGLVMPLLPGWLFFGVAFLLVFPDTRLARTIFGKIEQRWPSSRGVLRFLFGERS